MRKRAVAIVLHNNNLLVMWRKKGDREYYTLPGGGVEPGETVEEAVIREVKEETSLDIKISKQLYQHSYDDGTSQYFYLCDYISGEPQLDSQAVELTKHRNGTNFYKPMWLQVSKLSGTLLYPLEIRDWLINDLAAGFTKQVRSANLKVSKLRQTL
ncbi:MAG: NUDIX domain-containing protein [bacterium]|nr:NUDIX domain-containing protein [bacterium]